MKRDSGSLPSEFAFFNQAAYSVSPIADTTLSSTILLNTALRETVQREMGSPAPNLEGKRRSTMKRTVKGALVALSAIGLLAGATTSAQERSMCCMMRPLAGSNQPGLPFRLLRPAQHRLPRLCRFFLGNTKSCGSGFAFRN